MTTAFLKIGSRGSPLALTQSRQTVDALARANGVDADTIPIEVIKTSGDVILDRPLMAAGGKGLFTKELEEALLDGRIDAAIHSAKDMPTVLPDGLALGCWVVREDPRDMLITRDGVGLLALDDGAVVGTSALRRRAQVKRLRPDLDVVPLRGNVGTRQAKVAEGAVQATLLARAGLARLGALDEATMAAVATDDLLPSPAQGAIVIECRADDTATRDKLARLNDPMTEIAVAAERAFLAALDGSCRTPIAALAEIEAESLRFRGRLMDLEGEGFFEAEKTVHLGSLPLDAARTLGTEAGQVLREEAGEAFFASLVAAMEAYEAVRL